MDTQSSSSEFTYAFTYDVFLNFRGEDTRYGFTGYLYSALCNKGLHTFIDHEELQRGDEITSALEKAIEESRVFIIVFSQNYASSSFCLNELSYILKIKDKAQLVLPVFYFVDPSDVRHHRGSFGEALAEHEKSLQANNMEKLEQWKMALHQAANLSGFHFNGDKYEYEFIKEIVELVSRKVNRVPLHVADYPVGLESQVLKVKSLLDVGSDDVVHMVGIHGLGGVGKTTLAAAVYNSIIDHHFEALCFLGNVRETSNKHGLSQLQSNLLFETVGEKDIKLKSVNEGISIIQHRLQKKKVLLVVDDVEKREQLQAIVGRPDWFGPGSRVIITTRDKQLLACHNVKRTYEVTELNEEDALQLLCWKAFRMEKVDPRYQDVLNRAVTYASGLPLALEVIGSNLFEKSTEQWKSALDQYERIPNKEIQETLKVSYDALEEDAQSVFLDIACCFKEYELAEVEDILHAHHGHCMKNYIGVLVEKSLIKISWNDKVTLHDLIEDMGKEIVRKESPKEPGKRSRLWSHKDIIQVLQENKGTSEIEIIHMDFPLFEEVEWDEVAFKKMKNLKTLIIKCASFSKGPKHLPNTLRVLKWQRYPSQNLPNDFHPKKLAICKLPKSSFTSPKLAALFLKKKFTNLKSLSFDQCQHLSLIPDVSSLTQLEKFSFRLCHELSTIHYSIGFMEKLKILNAHGCRNLKAFPPIRLTSLEQLQLDSCQSLESFPEILGKMENITQLDLRGTSIKRFSLSFRNLTMLRHLILGWVRNGSISGCDAGMFIQNISMMPELAKITAFKWPVEGWILHKEGESAEKQILTVSSTVQSLNLLDCNLRDDFFTLVMPRFSNVKELNLSGNNFTVIPECIKECHFLTSLTLDNCQHLRDIRETPPNLKYFSAYNSPSLTSSCKRMLLSQELHEAGNTFFYLHGAEIPEWFECQSWGPSISFWFRNKFPAIAICLVRQTAFDTLQMEDEDDFPLENEFVRPVMIVNGNKHFFEYNMWMGRYTTRLFDPQAMKLKDEHLFEYSLNEKCLENQWNYAQITYEDWNCNPLLVQSGLHVLKHSGKEDVQFTDPFRKRKLDDDFSSSESQHQPLLKTNAWMYM